MHLWLGANVCLSAVLVPLLLENRKSSLWSTLPGELLILTATKAVMSDHRIVTVAMGHLTHFTHRDALVAQGIVHVHVSALSTYITNVATCNSL